MDVRSTTRDGSLPVAVDSKRNSSASGERPPSVATSAERRPFARWLARERSGPDGDDGVIAGGGQASALSGPLRRASDPPGPPARLAGRTAAVDAARAADRLLVGHGAQGAEARVRIGEGPLAGLEVRLVERIGAVEATVLTAGATSRETLAVALHEVATRLRRRGIEFRADASAPRPHPEPRPEDGRR